MATRPARAGGSSPEGRAVHLRAVADDTEDAYADWDAVYRDNIDRMYRLVFGKVGNRADAEDLTQQVALKAIPRLRPGSPPTAVRGYLFATARSVLGAFWSTRLGLSEAELRDDLALASPQVSPAPDQGVETVQQILAQLSDNYRRVLELRFLHGYSLKEVAAEMNSTVGAIKVMQLRALRAAAKVRLGEE